ncbi:SDR family oxidoreductase [Glycomyces algeriensis]
MVLGARRVDRLAEVAAAIEKAGGGGRAIALDVTDAASVEAFAGQIDRCDLLVNNAGGALGLESIADADLDLWQRMYDVNVLGTIRVTKALLPKLIESGNGQVVVIGSIAAHQPYPNGGGYNAAKHAEAAVTRVLRLELLGQPVRVCEIDPGMVETEFSLVRFEGDQARADAVYAGMTPLTADDIAETITWVATRPAHVNVDQITITPRDQAGAQQVHRRNQ